MLERTEYLAGPRLPQYRHRHECANCEPIGKIRRHTLELVGGELISEISWVDCYVCVRPFWASDAGVTVVARFGEDGDYHSRNLTEHPEPCTGDPMLAWCIQLLAMRNGQPAPTNQ